MAVAKKSNYVSYKVEMLRNKADELEQYMIDRPFDKLTDRIEWKPTSKGGQIPMVIQTIEGQVKMLKEILKDLPSIIEAIDKLEQIEESKKKVALGSSEVPLRMR